MTRARQRCFFLVLFQCLFAGSPHSARLALLTWNITICSLHPVHTYVVWSVSPRPSAGRRAKNARESEHDDDDLL